MGKSCQGLMKISEKNAINFNEFIVLFNICKKFAKSKA